MQHLWDSRCGGGRNTAELVLLHPPGFYPARGTPPPARYPPAPPNRVAHALSADPLCALNERDRELSAVRFLNEIENGIAIGGSGNS